MLLGFAWLPVMAEPTNEPSANTAKKEKVESPAEIFARAELAMQRTDAKAAVDLLREAAGQNYIPAQVVLGEWLDLSEFDEEAVGWFMTAAYQGNPAGAFGLGKMYSSGEGIAKSDEKALFWFRFAAEKNHLAAVKVMLSTYKYGKLGQKIDLEQANLWEDKLPALEEIQRKENARKKNLAKEEAERAAEEKKAALEEAKKKYLEAQSPKENETANKKAADVTATSGAAK